MENIQLVQSNKKYFVTALFSVDYDFKKFLNNCESLCNRNFSASFVRTASAVRS